MANIHVEGAYAFILILSKSLGLAALNFQKARLRPKPTKWLVAVSPLSSIISCVTVTIIGGWALFGVFEGFETEAKTPFRKRSALIKLVMSSNMLAVVITSTIGVYSAQKRIRKIVQVLKQLTMVDNFLGNQKVSSQEQNLCAFVVCLLILWVLLLVNDFASCFMKSEETKKHYKFLCDFLPFYLLYNVVIVLEVQFAYTVHVINIRIKKLNAALRAVEDYTSPTTAIYLGGLSDVYGMLCTAANDVNASFGISIVTILISILLHLIVSPYFLILEAGHAHLYNLIIQVLWCLAHFIRLIYLVESSHRTKQEFIITGSIIGELLGHPNIGADVLRRLEIFSKQYIRRCPEFVVMGIFKLDRSLLAKVSGAVTTYLVILLQLQKHDDDYDNMKQP